MKVLVVSGFLGAGKTTFIKELSVRTGHQFTILENEYGAVGMDADLLKDASGGSDNIWEMNNGCICCSKKGDFAASILTISNTSNTEFLIIEPSGVGKLSNVISHIKNVEYEQISILAPLTIVDGNNINSYRNEFGNIYDDQILSSATVVISKMEKASYDERQRAVSQIKAIYPDADIIDEHYTTMPDSWWNDLLTKLHDGTKIIAPQTETEDFDSLALEDITLSHPEKLPVLLEDIIRNYYGKIIRAKGSFSIGNTGLKFDLVDKKYSVLICPKEEIEKSALVFIGKDIQKEMLNKYFLKMAKFKKVHLTGSIKKGKS